METGRKLSWLETQDVSRFDTEDLGKSLLDEWGSDWFWHIATLYDEITGCADVQSATHL